MPNQHTAGVVYLGNPPHSRRCSKCRQYKPFTEYGRDKSQPYGIRTLCTECRKRSRRQYKDRADRFWKLFHKKTVRVGECIEWQGGYSRQGKLPCVSWEGRTQNLRRVLYSLAVGEVSSDQFVVATCRNGRCVRHSHLQLLSSDEWMAYIHADMPTADQHHARLHPEWRARGERHGAYTHPERLARGERHGTKTRPGSVPRGEQHHSAKLKESDIPQIFECRSLGMLPRQIAAQFGVTENTIRLVLQRKTWTHVQ